MQQPFVKWGLISGGLGVILGLIYYLINPELSFSTTGMLSGIAIPLVCMYLAGLEERALLGGYITWGQALKVTFLTIVIGFFISSTFQYIMSTFIDPDLVEMQIEKGLELAEKMVSLGGQELSEDDIERIRENSSPSFVKMIWNSLGAIACVGFPISAIMSLFIMKKDPEKDVLA